MILSNPNILKNNYLNYRNYLNISIKDVNISKIHSDYQIKLFYFIKHYINKRIQSKIKNIKVKENISDESIIYLEIEYPYDFDSLKVYRLLKYYSDNLKYNLLYIQIKTQQVETFNKKKDLQELFIKKYYPLQFDCFSRINKFTTHKIYEKIALYLKKNNNILTCFGRDIIIPSNLKFDIFKKVDVVSHNKSIIDLSIKFNPKINTYLLSKDLYYKYLEKNNLNNTTIFISASKKGLLYNFIEALTKITNLNLIIIWCDFLVMKKDVSLLLNAGFYISDSDTFEEHPHTNINNLSTLINFII